jgi:hypothetical protein
MHAVQEPTVLLKLFLALSGTLFELEPLRHFSICMFELDLWSLFSMRARIILSDIVPAIAGDHGPFQQQAGQLPTPSPGRAP